MIRIEPIPHTLEWSPEPVRFSVENGGLTALAAARTDLFVDPLGKVNVHNAAKLLFDAEGDFLLSAQVTVGFNGTFDAGVLAVWQGGESWGKVCFEYSPANQPMVVSVVTKGTSDDCNSVLVEGNSVYLRVARIGAAFAFHYSTDAKLWHLVRVFRLQDGPVKAGFLVQAPVGEGCEVRFSDIRFDARTLGDIRSGE